ncbi:MAG: DUF3127 domain-containing protein [Haloferula sp.]
MANSFELTGTVKHILDLQEFNSGFTKREFVIEVPDGNYPQMVKFETVKDRTKLLDSLAIGDEVQVTFDIRGNEYKERFYVNLNAWKIAKTSGGGGGDEGSSNSSMDASFDNEPDESDEIPF